MTTPTSLVPHMDSLMMILEKLAPVWIKNNQPTIFNVVVLVSGVVEKLSANNGSLDSDTKLDLAILFLPLAIDHLVNQGLIDQQTGTTIKELAGNIDMVKGIIKTAVNLANNPNFLQSSTWVKSATSCC